MKKSEWFAQTPDGKLHNLKNQMSFNAASAEAIRRFGETVKTVRFPLPDGGSSEDIRTAASVLGRKGGSVKSEAKTRAARENGLKGGRPKGELVRNAFHGTETRCAYSQAERDKIDHDIWTGLLDSHSREYRARRRCWQKLCGHPLCTCSDYWGIRSK